MTSPTPIQEPEVDHFVAASDWRQRFKDGLTNESLLRWREWNSDPDNRDAFDSVCAVRSCLRDPRMREAVDYALDVCSYIHDEELPDELLRRVRACARAITHDPEAVKEIEQQVKLKLSTMDRERWNQVARKWGYVIRIAQNESRTWLRREARQPGSVMSRKPREQESRPSERAIPDGDIKELKRLFEPLGRECAEVFIRVWILGRAVRTVSRTMKLPVSRVRKHLDTARLHYLNLVEGDPKVPSFLDRLVSLLPLRRS